MNVSELEKEWFDFTIQFVEKLNEHNGDWAKLNESEQELAALWKLEMDINNGGFLQFFTNWGIECYESGIRCLKKIKATKSLQIVTSAYKIINKYKDDKRLTSYQDLYDLMSENDTKEMDILDNEYWELPDNIPELTFIQYDKIKYNKDHN